MSIIINNIIISQENILQVIKLVDNGLSILSTVYKISCIYHIENVVNSYIRSMAILSNTNTRPKGITA